MKLTFHNSLVWHIFRKQVSDLFKTIQNEKVYNYINGLFCCIQR